MKFFTSALSLLAVAFIATLVAARATEKEIFDLEVRTIEMLGYQPCSFQSC